MCADEAAWRIGELSTRGWSVEEVGQANTRAAPGVAIRKFTLTQGFAFADARRSAGYLTCSLPHKRRTAACNANFA